MTPASSTHVQRQRCTTILISTRCDIKGQSTSVDSRLGMQCGNTYTVRSEDVGFLSTIEKITKTGTQDKSTPRETVITKFSSATSLNARTRAKPTVRKKLARLDIIERMPPRRRNMRIWKARLE